MELFGQYHWGRTGFADAEWVLTAPPALNKYWLGMDVGWTGQLRFLKESACLWGAGPLQSRRYRVMSGLKGLSLEAQTGSTRPDAQPGCAGFWSVNDHSELSLTQSFFKRGCVWGEMLPTVVFACTMSALVCKETNAQWCKISTMKADVGVLLLMCDPL